MLSYFFPPSYSGSAVQALNLSLHLQRRGVEPFIVSANLTGSPAEDVVHGVPVHRVPVIGSPGEGIPRFWVSVARLLWRRRDQFDIIHAHGTLQHGIASLLGRRLRKPTILKVAMADSDIAFERQGRLVGAIGRFTVERFDCYIATTDAIAAEFEQQGLDAAKVRRIPNGVDTTRHAPLDPERRAALRRELRLPDGPIVSCVAIVQARKNIDGILRMWRAAVERGAPGHLILIGPVEEPGGPFIRGLEAFIDAHDLRGRVSMLGKRDDVPRLLQASDVFLFPSKKEGMPNAVLEAMACGVPALVSSTAGVARLIVPGVNGYALDPADERAFVDRLVPLLRDESLRASLGRSARAQVVENFSLERIAQRYQELYAELLAGRTPRRVHA